MFAGFDSDRVEEVEADSSTGAPKNRLSGGQVSKTDDAFSVFEQSTRQFTTTELQTPVSAARILSNRTPSQNRSFKACSRQCTGETGRTARFDRQRLRFADIRRHAALTLSLVQNSAVASLKRCGTTLLILTFDLFRSVSSDVLDY